MKYMLAMNTPGNGPYRVARWPPQDLKAHIAFMMRFARKLGAAGELVSAEGLAGPDQAKLVRAGQAGLAALDEALTLEDCVILALYGVLRGASDNPMVALNEAIATAMVHGPAAGLSRLDALAADPRVLS